MDVYAGLRERIERGETVVMDGGIGTELVRRGVRWRGHGMRRDAETVQQLHEEYLAAGADVIRTNTFQLNHRVYLNVFRNAEHMRHIGATGLETRATELLGQAVALARAARERSGRTDTVIAGVMSPLEHCFRPDLAPSDDVARAEHREIAAVLVDAGVDLLLLESMNTVREACAATAVAAETGKPVWVSFVIGPDGNVLGGESLGDAARSVRDLGAEVVLVNCAPPEDLTRAVETLVSLGYAPVGAYAHIGKFDPPSWKFEFFPQFSQTEAWPPERYVSVAETWRQLGARVIGGCCGTQPAHIRALREALGSAGKISR